MTKWRTALAQEYTREGDIWVWGVSVQMDTDLVNRLISDQTESSLGLGSYDFRQTWE